MDWRIERYRTGEGVVSLDRGRGAEGAKEIRNGIARGWRIGAGDGNKSWGEIGAVHGHGHGAEITRQRGEEGVGVWFSIYLFVFCWLIPFFRLEDEIGSATLQLYGLLEDPALL